MQLDLEEALTRKSGSAYYNLGCHMLWIGELSPNLTLSLAPALA